jgi:hypothetical protein
MKARVEDKEVFQSLKPSDIAAYLRAHHWDLNERSGSSAIYTLVVGAGASVAPEVQLPLTTQIRDYATRVADLLKVLSVVEERSELDVLAELDSASADVPQIVTHPAGPSGSAPISDGVKAYQSLHSLLLAAACSAASDGQRAVQPSRKPAQALDLIRRVRIGAPVKGSFVLSAHVPVPPSLSHQESGQLFSDDSEPFERFVTSMLQRAVVAAHSAAVDALVSPDGLDVFESKIEQGVSANLLEALSGFSGESGESGFEVRMSWALSRPKQPSAPIQFGSELMPVLTEAARRMRERTGEQGVRIIGDVVRLHREPSSPLGEISLVGPLDGDPTERDYRVWVTLSESEYNKASDAHARKQRLALSGDLKKVGNKWRLANSESVVVVPTPEDS